MPSSFLTSTINSLVCPLLSLLSIPQKTSQSPLGHGSHQGQWGVGCDGTPRALKRRPFRLAPLRQGLWPRAPSAVRSDAAVRGRRRQAQHRPRVQRLEEVTEGSARRPRGPILVKNDKMIGLWLVLHQAKVFPARIVRFRPCKCCKKCFYI